MMGAFDRDFDRETKKPQGSGVTDEYQGSKNSQGSLMSGAQQDPQTI